jgi:site-specific DNA-methyltransferase (adenine-specific)
LINQITFGNCFDILPEIPEGSIDLILTDPPYVTALADLYKSWNLSNHDFEVLADQFKRILRPAGQIVMFADYLTSLAIGNAFQKYFAFRFYYIWIKSHGQPIGKKQPISNTELILVWKRKKAKTSSLTFNPQYSPGAAYRKMHKGGNPTRKKHNGYLTENLNGDRFPTQTLYYPAKDNLPESERLTGFPCQKSIGLIGYLVNSLSNPGDLILDPFSGSGTTAIACHRLGRRFIAIERDPIYYAESVERLKNEMAQGNLFAKNETSLAGLNNPGQIKVNVPVLAENCL